MLEKEFEYYIKNQEELVKKYEGKYLIIVGKNVVDVCNSDEEAYFKAIKKYEKGTFLIQFCEAGDSSYTQTFHSRVSFA